MENNNNTYLFEAQSRAGIEQYFRFKQKHDFDFNPEEWTAFQESTTQWLHQLQQQYHFEYIILPETTNQRLLQLCANFNTIVLKKRTIPEVLPLLNNQHFQKKEKEKLLNTLNQMNTLKIAQLAGNQRHRFIPLLFHPIIPPTQPFILLDDSAFSGTTLEAMQIATQNKAITAVTLFSKNA